MRKVNELIKGKLNVIIFFQGRFVSELGGSLFNFGSSLMILDITGKGLAFAISLVVTTLPKIMFSFLAGAVCDVFDKKRIIVVCDLLSGILLSIYYLLLNDTSMEIVGSIYLVTFLLSVISVFFSVSMSSAIPQLVDDENNISRLNGINQTVSSISSVLGPALGGLIYNYFDYKVFVMINALSFLLSGISEIFIKLKVSNHIVNKDRKVKGKKNLRNMSIFFKERKDILNLVLTCACMNIFLIIGFSVPMPYIVNNVLKMNSYQFGILKMSLIIGTILGSLKIVVSSIRSNLIECYKKNIINIGVIYIVFSVLSIIDMAIYCRIILFSLLFICSSICIIRINIPLRTMLQKNIPDNIRGKILGILNTILSIASPLGNIIAGILIDRVKFFILPLVSGIMLVIIAFNIKINNEESKFIEIENVMKIMQKLGIHEFMYNEQKRIK